MDERPPTINPMDGVPESHIDPELLTQGDVRNVVDHYRLWRLESIVADLDTRRSQLQIAIENLEHDFNIGSIVRTANAFNVAAVHIVGRRRWNRRGAMVTDRYLHIHHHPDVGAFGAWVAEAKMPLIGIDNITGSTPIEGSHMPSPAVMVFGQEGPGLSKPMRQLCGTLHAITQYGSTRSMNVGAAAAIAMYEWSRQHPPATHASYSPIACSES